jgi:hypothetical protein
MKIKKFNYTHVVHEMSVVLNHFLKNEHELNAYLLKLAKCVSDADGDEQKHLEVHCESEFYDWDSPAQQRLHYEIDPAVSEPFQSN